MIDEWVSRGFENNMRFLFSPEGFLFSEPLCLKMNVFIALTDLTFNAGTQFAIGNMDG